jgi:hypothetical protein
MTNNIWLATACAITGAFIGVLGAAEIEPKPEAEAEGSTGLAVQGGGGFGGQTNGTVQGGEGFVPDDIGVYYEPVEIDGQYLLYLGTSKHIDPFLSKVFTKLNLDQGNCFSPRHPDLGGFGFFADTVDFYVSLGAARRYSDAGASFLARPPHPSGDPEPKLPDLNFFVTRLESLGDLVQSKLNSDFLFRTYVRSREMHEPDGFVRVSALLNGTEIAAGHFATYAIGGPKFRVWYETTPEVERHVFFISIDGEVTHCGKLPPIEGRLVPSDG